MTQNEIIELVNEAISKAISDQSVANSITLIVALILMGLSVYIGKYLGKKGANQALKEDLKSLTNEVESVKNEYAKELEDYKRALNKRDQASKISVLLAKKMISASKGVDPQQRQDLIDYQALLWELSMWLPEDIALKLNASLHGEKLSILDAKDLVIETRKLLNPEEVGGKLKAENLIHIDNDVTRQNIK